MLKRLFAIAMLLPLAFALAGPAQADTQHPSHKHHVRAHRHHHHHHRRHRHGHHPAHARRAHAGQSHNDGRQPISRSRNRTCKTAPCFKKHPSGHYTTPLRRAQGKDPS